MPYRFLSAIAGLLLGLHATSSAQVACHQDLTCDGCAAVGRAYVKVGGLFCTPCMKFCMPQIAAGAEMSPNPPLKSPGREVTSTVEAGVVLHASIDLALIRVVAQVNPDAATLLQIVNVRSRGADNSMPIAGTAHAVRLASVPSVEIFLAGRDPDVTLLAPASSVRGIGGDRSQVTWALVTHDGRRPWLLVKHRVTDAQGGEVMKLYPDIRVELVAKKRPGTDELMYESAGWAPAQ